MAASNLHRLSVGALDDGNAQTPPTYYPYGSNAFNCMAAAATLALKLLESPRGSRCLTQNGEDIIANLDASARANLPTTTAAMETRVQDFLQKVRTNFPFLVLRELGNCNGRTTKASWQGQDWDYRAKEAAIMEMDSKLVNALVSAAVARQSQAWDADETTQMQTLQSFHTILLRVAITMAHELVHYFTGFLLQSKEMNTPAAVTYGRGNDPRFGESGRTWEGRMFGGSLEIRQDSDIVKLAVLPQHGEAVWVVQSDIIGGVVRGDFRNLPFNDEDVAIRRTALNWAYLGEAYAAGGINPPTLSLAVILDLKLYNGPQYIVNDVDMRNFSLDPKKVEIITTW